MRWRVEFSRDAAKWLRKADRQTARRLTQAAEAIGALQDPRSRGGGLTGPLAGLWKYRVGDYRIICDIRDDELVVLAVEIGHRSEIYD